MVNPRLNKEGESAKKVNNRIASFDKLYQGEFSIH